MIRLELSWPVSFSSYFNGRLIRSRRGRIQRDQWITEVCSILGGKPEPLIGPVCLEVWLHPPNTKTYTTKPWDQDNYMGKAQIDILNQCELFNDDSQVWDFLVHKRGHVKRGQVIVELSEI